MTTSVSDLLAPVEKEEPSADGVTPRTLRDYQVQAADAVEDQWREGYERTSVVLPTGSGKPIFDNELVPTPDRGFVRMSDLKVGDYVFGSDGEPTRIVHVDPQGVIPLRRVHFDDGASVVAGAGHLWEIKRKGRFPRVETTDWIRKQGYQDRDGYMWRLPIIDPVNYPARDLPLDPYLMGTLIANGSMKTGPVITTPDTHVIDELERRGVVLNKHHVDEKYCPRWGVPGIRDVLRELGMWGVGSRDKRIPRVYLEASDTARLDLLRGLMDGDGSSRSGGRRVCNYHTLSPGLSDDVAELVWSLGGRAKQHTTERSHEDKPTEYEVGILMPEGISPFLSPRKVRNEHPRRTFKPRRAIVDIEDVADGPATCIQVDAEDGLFAVTDRYVLTHNSSVIAELARRAVRRGQRVVALAHRDELLNQMRDTYSLVAPDLEPGGIVKAEQDEHDRDFVCASFQTLASSPSRIADLGVRDVILVDECHHALAPSYLRVLYDLGLSVAKPLTTGKSNKTTSDVFADHVSKIGTRTAQASDYLTRFDHIPEIRACGFTATMSRSDSEQLGKVWSTVAYERDIEWAISNGFLIAPNSMTVHVPELAGLSKVKTTAGDFNNKQLAEVMEASVESTVDAVARHAKDRNMIVFAASVDHARQLAEGLSAAGIPAEAVVGSNTRDERDAIYTRFNTGAITALVTVMVLTEGADFPRCDCVVMARPTRSQILFCFDADTEILTRDGWIPGTHIASDTELAAFDTTTGTISWEQPSNHFTRPRARGERMVKLTTDDVDMRVTENHRVIYTDATNTGQWQVAEAGELVGRTTSFTLPLSGHTTPTGIEHPDDHIPSLIRALANLITTHPENCDMYLPLAADMTHTQWRHLLCHLAHHNADTTDTTSHAPGDCTTTTIHTTSTDLANWIQHHCLIRGISCVIDTHTSATGKTSHILYTTATRATTPIDPSAIHYTPAYRDETVWCATVSTGALVVRRNGKAYISGNCQMVGRALRLYTDPDTGKEKDSALVLDLSGAANDQTLITLTDLWPDADDEAFNSDGTRHTPEPADDDTTSDTIPGEQRRGSLKLEAIDLLRRAPGDPKPKTPPHRRIVTLATADGIMFIPSSRGGGGIMLWPPYPNKSDRVCIVKYTDYGRDAAPMLNHDGTIMVDSWAVMYDHACRAAFEGKDANGNRTAIMRRAQWRQPGKKPSTKQLDTARKVGAVIPEGSSMADVSDAISRSFMEINVRNMQPKLREWGLLG